MKVGNVKDKLLKFVKERAPELFIALLLFSILVFVTMESYGVELNLGNVGGTVKGIIATVTPRPTSIQGSYQNKNIDIDLPTITPLPTLNPDPFVNCECGDEIRYIKSSECNKMVCCLRDVNCGGGKFFTNTFAECNQSVCCEIGNKWYLYKDKNECTRDQNRRSSYSNSGESLEFEPWPTLKPLPTFEPWPTYGYTNYKDYDTIEKEIRQKEAECRVESAEKIRGAQSRYGGGALCDFAIQQIEKEAEECLRRARQ